MRIKGYRVKDLINPKKWFAAFRHFVGGKYIFIKKDDFDFTAELYIYRRGKCGQCFNAGKCVGYKEEKGCGCPFLGLAVGAGETCGREENPQWEGTTKEEWNQFKEETGIQIKATRK